MPATAKVQHVVDTIDEAIRRGTDAALRAGGALMPPQVHLLVEHDDEPYLGYVSCRPFYRGNDVVRAMALMGVAGSLTGASRLLVVWEHQDLCTALELPGAESAPYGQVVVDAARDSGHVLRWRPFRLHGGGPNSIGLPGVVPEWGDAVLHAQVELPNPVAALLAAWRRPQVWTRAERADALAHLEESGYRMRWVERSGGARAAAG
jgi:hypothetical protein